HTLSLSLPGEDVRLSADPTRLQQVVSNLLDNAAKYSDPGSSIRVGADLEEDDGAWNVVIRIKDNGIGMAPDLLPHVFELFTQADRSLERTQGGLGIGLTVVRQLVELHGGTIGARSEGPGKGSEFVIRLPAEYPPTVASPA
ncbi:MAG: ATP-binding protein, partial [Armatimonadota bacterium]|nr:ATP-binding protein [Armatimonadota bacterium]